jgi:hypothetical protein
VARTQFPGFFRNLWAASQKYGGAAAYFYPGVQALSKSPESVCEQRVRCVRVAHLRGRFGPLFDDQLLARIRPVLDGMRNRSTAHHESRT